MKVLHIDNDNTRPNLVVPLPENGSKKVQTLRAYTIDDAHDLFLKNTDIMAVVINWDFCNKTDADAICRCAQNIAEKQEHLPIFVLMEDLNKQRFVQNACNGILSHPRQIGTELLEYYQVYKNNGATP